MYIRRVTLHNIRCFEDVDVQFISPEGVRDWTLILGDNGVGKTSLLRSIAMGLCDGTSAAALLRELYGEWVREGAETGTIKIELAAPGESAVYSIHTTIEKLKSGDSRVSQSTTPGPDFPWDEIFVCAYGAARRAYGTQDYPEYSTVDSVYSLFNYDARLQNPELILRRIGSMRPTLGGVLERIDSVLMLPPGATTLGNAGIRVSGPWGEYSPLGSLGDGYQATLAWIIDFLGWTMFFDESMLASDISGIVIIDELEQHLHPRWQRKIVQLLRKQFPSVQFITTTHAPLCAIGSASLRDEECGLILLSQSERRVEVSPVLPPPRGQRADQLLTSYLFQLETAGDDETQFQIERYSDLLSQDRSDDQERELNQLRETLDQKLGSGGTELERRISQAVRNVLDRQPESKIHPEVVDYEVRRQLHALLS